MRITIVAVGRLKERHWKEAAQEYSRRLRPYASLRVVEVPDRDLNRDEARAIAGEGDDLLQRISDGTYTVALDREGSAMSSEDLASWLQSGMRDGRSDLTFVIGGAGGLAPEVLAEAAERFSLGRITLPHQLARVVLLEQLYRAFRIVRGEPYHR